jgi:hypothetical protein
MTQKFFCGQKVKTPDGEGIIVKLWMDFNALYFTEASLRCVIWYAEPVVIKPGSARFYTFEYHIDHINPLP